MRVHYCYISMGWKESIISFFNSYSFCSWFLSLTPLLCRWAAYSIGVCRSWSSPAITKCWNFPRFWLLFASWVLFLIPTACGFMGSGCPLAQVSLTILCIRFLWSGTRTQRQIKSCCLWLTMDNIVVLPDICIRDMKTAPFIPVCDGAGWLQLLWNLRWVVAWLHKVAGTATAFLRPQVHRPYLCCVCLPAAAGQGQDSSCCCKAPAVPSKRVSHLQMSKDGWENTVIVLQSRLSPICTCRFRMS